MKNKLTDAIKSAEDIGAEELLLAKIKELVLENPEVKNIKPSQEYLDKVEKYFADNQLDLSGNLGLKALEIAVKEDCFEVTKALLNKGVANAVEMDKTTQKSLLNLFGFAFCKHSEAKDEVKKSFPNKPYRVPFNLVSSILEIKLEKIFTEQQLDDAVSGEYAITTSCVPNTAAQDVTETLIPPSVSNNSLASSEATTVETTFSESTTSFITTSGSATPLIPKVKEQKK